MSALRCIECGPLAPTAARGWKAELADDPRDKAEPELAIDCPACHAREFGASRD
jgi:hypothetical protein